MAIGDLYESAAVHCTPKGKLYWKGVNSLERWHEDCASKRKRKKPEGRWCAPEHMKRGCSFKGEQIMASNFVKVTRKRGYQEVVCEYRGTIPIFGGDIHKTFACLSANAVR